jgi:hypothetical protein
MRILGVTVCTVLLLAGCSGSSTSTTSDVTISPQNSVFLVGFDRVNIALNNGRVPVLDAKASMDVPLKSSRETVALDFVGHEYAQVPVYSSVVKFDHTGDTVVTVHARYSDGSSHSGIAHINVTDKSTSLPVGYPVPAISQPVASTVNGDLSKIDTGVPGPDDWHTETIAQGLAQHQPMVLFFGTPGRCVSGVCGPTLSILKQLQATLGNKMLFEHIEPDYPAQSNILNPAYQEFGLTTEPWVYFVNSNGVVADRFEGSVVLSQLEQAAAGTLAGHVPAVTLGP